MRRKTPRNALMPFGIPDSLKDSFWMDKRAEQLGVAEFEKLTVLYGRRGMLKRYRNRGTKVVSNATGRPN